MIPENPNPSTADMLRDLVREIALYGRDLAKMFAAELGEKSRSLRMLGMLAGAAAVLLLFSFGLLTVALVGAIAYGLASWRWALFIVGVGWGILGLLLLLPVAHALRHGLWNFDHTSRRIREDSEYAKRNLAA